MSGFLSKVFSGGVSDIVDSVGSVVDRFHTSDQEKGEMKLALEQVITDRMGMVQDQAVARFEMVSNVIKAEMASGDNYTRRARPTLVYFGMLMIFFNHLVVPLVQNASGVPVAPYPLPTEFWAAWGGTVAIWSVGRSYEKRGASSKVSSVITGNRGSEIDRLLNE